MIYLRCTRLHFYLYVLFDMPAFPTGIENLQALFRACRDIVDSISLHPGTADHCPNFIFWMILSAGFTILRLVSSPFVDYLDVVSSKQLLTKAIRMIRGMSVANNDLPGRLAEVLVQLQARTHSSSPSADWQLLQLKVRSRMSLSIVFDSLWEWRKEFLADKNGNERGAGFLFK